MQKPPFFIAVQVTIILVVAPIVFHLIFWPYMWEGEFLSKWASVVTIFSLVIAPITYFLRQNEKEKDAKRNEITERTRASRNLYVELGDTLEAIRGNKHIRYRFNVNFGKNTATYTNLFFNHAIYDSLVFSGGIRFLDYELQQKIQDIFNVVKYHNYYLKTVVENQDAEDGSISATDWKYYELLDKNERQLLKKIPAMMKELKKRFGFESPKY